MSTKRAVILGVSAVALTAAITLTTMLPGSATPSSNVTTTTLGRGTIGSSIGVAFKGGTDVVVVQNTFTPGGSSGWHSHPGGAIVVVQQGELTLYKAVGNTCSVTTYTQGQSFFERPSDVQDGVNQGTTDAVAFVTFPGVPAGGSARVDQPDPGVCPGV
jgi:quercetin dioxygenase-like cupin family protein